MNTEEVVNYKIFLCAVGYEPEIRRLTIGRSVSTNYFYLKQKLINIFPVLKDIKFTISWKDRENDSIRICTDEELAIALMEMEGSDFKKIYVSTAPQHGKEGPIHPDITCDGCDRPVRGFRYKCMVCIDYDLCADCERSQNHPDHPMVRIPLPITQEMPFGRRFARDMHKISKHLDHFVNGFGRHWEKCEKKRSHGDARSGHHGCASYSFGFGNPFEFRPPHYTSMPTEDETPKKPETQPETHSKTAEPPEFFSSDLNPPNLPRESASDEQSAGSSQFRSIPSDEQRKFVEILKKGLAVILDPLGEGNVTIQTNVDVEAGQPSNSSETENVSANPADLMNTDSNSNITKKNKEKESPVLDDWTIIPDHHIVGATGDGGSRQSNTEMESEPSNANEKIYPDIEMSQSGSGVQESIDETVNRLIHMGFSDGEWLRSLVEAKRGNIVEVLHFLAPIPKPNATENKKN